jgi:adenylate kinase
MIMRDIINRLRPLRSQILFHGSDRETDHIELGEKGALFSDFDTAAARGRFVCECEVSIDEARDEFEGKSVRIWDESRIRVLNRFDTHCAEPLDEDALMTQMLMEFRPDAGSHVVMVTGKLAHNGLQRVMKALNPEEFTYEIRVLDKAVAAWFDVDFVAAEIGDLDGVDLVLLPGKTMGDEDELEGRIGVKVIRGTNCYSELPTFFEMAGVEVTSDDIVRPRILLLGRPGSGKSTYGGDLASTYEIPHISTGDLLRSGIEEGDPAAVTAKDHMERGELIPHYLMAELVRARLALPDTKNGYVLDGYPRTLRDVEWLVDMNVKPDAVVSLLVSEKEAEKRLLKRGRTGEDYVVIGKRLAEFEEETQPVVDHYREFPGFIEVDTEQGDVLSELYTRLETMFQKCLRPAE